MYLYYFYTHLAVFGYSLLVYMGLCYACRLCATNFFSLFAK